MSLVPHRFLFRMAFPCYHVKQMPLSDKGRLLDLGEEQRIDNFAAMDGQKNFADVRLAWNELGIGLQVEVRGKERLPIGNAERPRGSDGVTLWLDMRDARSNHRASRYCQQFHFLAAGAGTQFDEPAVVPAKIHRALDDAPLPSSTSVPLRMQPLKNGYLLEAFLPATALNGFDPEEHPRLGFFYSVRDDELGEQLLSLTPEFPFWEDPSLWSVLELYRKSK